MPLHVSSTCAHHREVKIALHSLWYHHTYRWPSRARVERLLSQKNEIKLIVKQILCINMVKYWDKLTQFVVPDSCICSIQFSFDVFELVKLFCLFGINEFYIRWCQTSKRALLTYSMVQSPSWEANWFEAGQEIPRISRNPKVHYCTHKRPPPV